MDSPFEIVIYDRAFTRKGFVSDAIQIEATPRHNAIGTTDVTVVAGHRQLGNIADTGARACIYHRGELLSSGYITALGGSGPTLAGAVRFTVTDDLWLLWRMLGWPVPGASDPYGTQGTKQDSRTGPAETVLKGFIAANKHHLIDTITVATDLARGATIGPISARMTVLADILMSEVDKAGIGITVKQSGTGLLLDAYVPQVYPHELSESAGTIIGWEWSQSAPTSTRSIIGGPNENTSREFRRVIDSTRETSLGYSIESFVDAKQADNNAAMDAAGAIALAEAGPKSGFKVSLSEAKHFRYGGSSGVRVGDLTTINIGGTTLTDVLREATLGFNRESGDTATPAIGERTDDPAVDTANFLAQAFRAIRDLRTR